MSEIDCYWPGILLAYSAYAVATLSPGPAVLAVIGTSMGVGRKSGIMLALGVVAGSLCWGTLAAVGLSALLASCVGAFIVLKLAGGLYLLWLAYKALRSAASPHGIAAQILNGPAPGPARCPARCWLRGWTVQMTNPKSILGWIAIISLGLQPGAPIWVFLAIVAGTSTFTVLFYGLCAVAFSTPAMVRVYGKARRRIDGALGAFFAYAGIRLLTERP